MNKIKNPMPIELAKPLEYAFKQGFNTAVSMYEKSGGLIPKEEMREYLKNGIKVTKSRYQFYKTDNGKKTNN